MLSPLTILKFNKHAYQSTNFAQKNNNYAHSVLPNIKSIYDKNSISFTHYMGFKDNLDVSDNPNYFKLPKIELSDGSFHQFTPDKSQIECAKKLLDGESVIYCAPTGTGKTAVAHFAVNKNLDENKRTLITVPLIALANDKYREFCKIYGEDNVGVMTGDRKVNSNAPIVIMTTEILHNQSDELENNNDIGTIIFDEAHYMSDKNRGHVWENSIISSVPNDIQVLCLSATVGNSDVFSNWIDSLNSAQKTSRVEIKPKERYVPLVWQVYNPEANEKFSPVIQYKIDIENLDYDTLNDKQKRAISRIYQIQNDKNEFFEASQNEANKIINSLKSSLKNQYQSCEDFEEDFSKIYPDFNKDDIKEIANLLRDEDSSYIKHLRVQSQFHEDFKTLIDDLNLQDKLPALIFKLSRNRCDEVAKNLSQEGLDLTDEEEKEQIKEIIEKYREDGYLGKEVNEDNLIKGFGVHHAGKLPQYRKLVEELFSKKLLKVVISTSTLSAGINMPARTVVLSDMTFRKYNPQTDEIETTTLSVNDFHQMAGRAGRRGIDSIGNVVLYNLRTLDEKNKKDNTQDDRVDELELAYKYMASKADNIISRFRPEPVLMSRYYSEYDDNSSLPQLVGKSFSIYSAKDKDKRLKAKVRQFENYSQILLKQGFLYRDYKNSYSLTPKGELLLNAQGANPLMVVSMIYDGLLDNITPDTLAQIAGYIADSNDIKEPKGMDSALKDMLSEKTGYSKQDIEDYERIKNLYKQKEERLLKSVKESKVSSDDVICSDSISGYILYLWSFLNSENENSQENFENISQTDYKTNDKDIKNVLSAKLSEGNIYRTISHSVSVLKQIQRICDYAIDNSWEYPNTQYYENVRNCASEALNLIDREPISQEDIL